MKTKNRKICDRWDKRRLFVLHCGNTSSIVIMNWSLKWKIAIYTLEQINVDKSYEIWNKRHTKSGKKLATRLTSHLGICDFVTFCKFHSHTTINSFNLSIAFCLHCDVCVWSARSYFDYFIYLRTANHLNNSGLNFMCCL